MKRITLQKSQDNRYGVASAPERGCSFGCRGGFTLVELLVVIAIISIVMGAVYSIFIRTNRVYISQEEVVAAQQEARSALEILGREIRMAGFIAANNQTGGSEPINLPAWAGNADSAIEIATVDLAAKTTTLAFKSNLDGADSDLDGDDDTEAVRYIYYHGDHSDVTRRNTLTREVLIWDGGWVDPGTVGPQLFLENIQNLTLTYQLADGSSTTTPADLDDIRGVVINITAQTGIEVEPYEGGKGVRTRGLVSNIQIRNMGLS